MDPISQQLMMGASGSDGPKIYVEDVFSTWLYTGNGSTQTITNGIDLAGEGGLVWIKSRSSAASHFLYDTVRGRTVALKSNSTDANDGISSAGRDLASFDATGFTLGTGQFHTINQSADTYASWTFRKAAKFFDVVTYTGTGSNRTIAHNLGSVPGCIIVKRTDTTGDWQVYHRSLANTEYMVLNSTAAKATGTTRWNSTTPTSTEFSLGTDATVNASGGTYVAYLFAHDAGGFGDSGNDSVVKCGSYNDASAGTVTLGWEPQFVLYKLSSGVDNWQIVDNMRGFLASGSSQVLYPNATSAESGANTITLTPTGFSYPGYNTGTYIYIAIRRGPMKTPTSGTEVFSVLTGTGSSGTVRTTGFPIDLHILSNPGQNFIGGHRFVDRLRGVSTNDTLGGRFLTSTSAAVEVTSAPYVTLYFSNTGFKDATIYNGAPMVWWNFRRAPGFFDVVCYNGTTNTLRTVSHNLGVVPELMIFKVRSGGINDWYVYSAALGNTKYLRLNDTSAATTSTTWLNSTTPTSSVFTLQSYEANWQTHPHVAYLFATLPGISKVGSYTGTGTTLDVNCGFASGARFVLIKRTDSTGDWYVWDSARGIIAANDPYLLLNSTAAEVTNTDYIDPLSSGFQISSTAPAAINANGGSFIYLAIA